RGLADPRAACIYAFFRMAEVFLPRVILIENVPGFLTGPRCAIGVVTRAFTRINRRAGTHYRAEWRTVDAADYGGPQRRRRALLVARRDGQPFAWPMPTHQGNPLRAWDALRDLPDDPALPMPSGQWARLLPSIPEGQNYLWHTVQGGGLALFG